MQNWVDEPNLTQLAKSLRLCAGRFAKGSWILLLKQQVTVDDFELSGLTLRSGGGAGLSDDT
jgi:hypothetical protein